MTRAALALFGLVLCAPLQAAVFTVTKTADTLDGACDHDCSLREAVSAANAAAGLDVVRVPAGVYVLSRKGASEDANATGDLDVLDDLLLVGAGAGSTILDGAGSDRLLHARTRAEIHGVTIRNGRADADRGGGLFVDPASFSPPVLLHHSVVQGNQALEGGGIYVSSELVLRESAVLDNRARIGGGIAGSSMDLWLSQATVAGNVAEASGGGLSYRSDSSVSISGSTIAFNRAGQTGGGLDAFTAPFPTEESETIVGSILAGNTAPEHPDCSGTSLFAHNVVGVGLGCGAGPANRVGTEEAPLDARLAPRNGRLGPTPVHPLLPGSPALSLVPAESCASGDQAGQTRSAPCEAGAWEAAEPPACVPGGPVLCLQGGRFRATAEWRKAGLGGDAQADPVTRDTGNYWFFSPDNLEVMVKVLDGCGLNGRWWVFSSGLTDVGVTLRVEDLATGLVWERARPEGTTYAPILDTDAFECLPGVDPAPPSPGLAEGLPADLAPAILEVTTAADTFDGACDHHCSLREAVAASNAREGAEAIVVPPGVYALTRLGPFEDGSATGDLDTDGPLTILGAGAARTILDGNGTDRVLHASGQPYPVEIHGVTVRNGWARGSGLNASGGGIFSLSLLTLVDSVVSGNRADSGGGIWALDLIARGTTISGNVGISGGGVFAFQVRLSNVTLSGNLGRHGGALFRMPQPAEGESEAADSTVTGNTATVAGGGFFIPADIDCPPSGGLCPEPPYLRITRSVVAGNTAPEQPDCANLENEGGFNVFGVGESCLASPTDRAGTLAAPLDPRLTPLGDHGGPTPTHVPLADSPALDLGPLFSCPAVDQRDRPRAAGAGCDAGSVERLPSCQPDEDTLCLGEGDRFRVTARWTTQGTSGPGKAVPLRLDSGAFWFFDAGNLELTVKVLDGCGVNQRFWVFLTGLTDVGVEVEVEDTATGRTWKHTHAAGAPLQPRLDTNALDSCSGS